MAIRLKGSIALAILLVAVLVVLAPAHAQSNSTLPDCTLFPANGDIVAAATYVMDKDCKQSTGLHITAGLPANSTVTIEGKGYTIDASSLNGSDPFLNCVGHNDNTALVVNDLTIKGGGHAGDGAMYLWECDVTLNRVTLTESGSRALFGWSAQSRTYTLNSVLVEKPIGWYNYHEGPGALEFSGDATVNIGDIVFRDVTDVAAMVKNSSDYSGTTNITFNGCLSLERTFPQFSIGSVTDSSTGKCAGTIGNGGSVSVSNPAPVASACGLPLKGVLQTSASYVLKNDCQLRGPLYIPKGLTVKIDGKGFTIRSASGKRGIHTAGTTTIENIVYDGGSQANLVTALRGNLTVRQSTFKNQKRPLRLFDNTIRFENVLFEDNDVGTYYWGSVMQVYRGGDVTIHDSIIRNNKGGRGAILLAFPYLSNIPKVNLTGYTTFENNSPADTLKHNNSGTLTDNTSNSPAPGDLLIGAPLAVYIDIPAPSISSDESSPGAGRRRATPIPICSGEWLNRHTGIRVWATYGLCSGVQFRRLEAGWVTGNQQVIDAGFMDAVDVWGYAEQGVEVCFPAYGAMVLLDAANVPRTLEPLEAYLDGNLTCARFAKAGTAVLISPQSGLAPPPVRVAAAPVAISGCLVKTSHFLKLRLEPNGARIGSVSKNATLEALSRTEAWFEVDANGVTGWISAEYVTTAGDCDR